MTPYRAIIIVSVAVCLIIFCAPYTHWDQCEICGVQQIERGIFRTKVDAWSADELDEYGTYAQWKALTGKTKCEHRFSEVKHKTPAMTLDQLNQKHP